MLTGYYCHGILNEVSDKYVYKNGGKVSETMIFSAVSDTFIKIEVNMSLLGRKKEQEVLGDCLDSEQAEFVVVYGRRRVGKTYLVREFFNNEFTFYATGVNEVNTKEQLEYFNDSLVEYGCCEKKAPQNWREAFGRLKELLCEKDVKRDPLTGKKIVFLDELPWMDTAKSGFKTALEHFWNGWGASQKDLLLIVCGSATSWIIQNVLGNHGGLYNRVTRQIHLKPFSLFECEEFLKSKGLSLSRKDVTDCYMVFGGIPYYLNLLNRRYSVVQNIDALLFQENGQLYYEYDHLFASLFRKPQKHLEIIKVLAKKRCGKTRAELIKETKIADGSLFTKAVEELEQCGFIRAYKNYAKKQKEQYYQLIDPFVLFYMNFRTEKKYTSWAKYYGTPGYYSWRGNAYEILCLNHLSQIKEALGISGVDSMEYSWRSVGDTKGAQIDLLIDRMDNVINVCEMKYSSEAFVIDSDYEKELTHKLEVFRGETKNKKTLHLTLISASGLERNRHSNVVINLVPGDELFRPG